MLTEEEKNQKFHDLCEGYVKFEVFVSQLELVQACLKSGLFNDNDIKNEPNVEITDYVSVSEWMSKMLLSTNASVLINDYGYWWVRDQSDKMADDFDIKRVAGLMCKLHFPEYITEYVSRYIDDDDDVEEESEKEDNYPLW